MTKRRSLLKGGALSFVGVLAPVKLVWSKEFMTAQEAQQVIWGDEVFSANIVELTKEQMRSIRSTSKTRVRANKINSFRSEKGNWFILDQVIGKHENIDIAVGINFEGKIEGIEVLVYRESYGHQIMNPKWLAQFFGRDSAEVLKLDDQIKNISGATLSCRHITDGVNRLVHTWEQILQHV